MRRDTTLHRMNRINADDAMVQALIDAIGQSMDSSDADLQQLVQDLFFDSCSIEVLRMYEMEAGITPNSAQTEDDRRSALIAKWKANNKCDLQTLRITSNSWKNGTVIVDFADDKISVTFNDKGIPSDLQNLKNALEEVKPAHIPIEYIFIFTSWSELAGASWESLSETTWDAVKVR